MSDSSLKFFIYCRKSSEDQRQAASIEDQLRELESFADQHGLPIVAEPFTEEKSAKAPGRAVFSKMISQIEDREANALLCWDIDRLYRNPVDGGRVRWLLQNSVIREIRTPFRRFQPEDAGLLMGVEGGRAVDHIITLRKGVLRGFRGKLEKGWRPGPAPPGYQNNSDQEQGKRTISPDPQRFDLIRRGWDLMLTGDYSVRDIQRLAEEEWGLRSPQTKRLGGKPYTLSAWYRIFSQPFYYGKFWWKEPGTEDYRLYDGAHEPMITKAEFDRVQLILGRTKGRSSREEQEFAFTGLIRCGECGGMITAERKYQVRCSNCSTKFSALNRDGCRNCKTPIDNMEDPSHLRYIYYHCTKRKKGRSCSQSYVRAEDLEGEIDRILQRIAISEPFKDWAIRALEEDRDRDEAAMQDRTDSLKKRKAELERQVKHINQMATSPDTDWELISREELKERKLDVLDELEDINEQLAAQNDQEARAEELSKRTFRFAASARFWLREGDPRQKRDILAALGSNRTLIDENLELELQKPFQYIEDLRDRVPSVSPGFEPEGNPSTNGKSPSFRSEIPALCRATNDVRTWWERNVGEFEVPVFALHKGKTDA